MISSGQLIWERPKETLRPVKKLTTLETKFTVDKLRLVLQTNLSTKLLIRKRIWCCHHWLEDQLDKRTRTWVLRMPPLNNNWTIRDFKEMDRRCWTHWALQAIWTLKHNMIKSFKKLLAIRIPFLLVTTNSWRVRATRCLLSMPRRRTQWICTRARDRVISTAGPMDGTTRTRRWFNSTRQRTRCRQRVTSNRCRCLRTESTTVTNATD